MRMAVFVLQAFAVERGAASGRAEQEPACTLIASRPAQIADALEAEHRIEDEEWQQRLAVVGVAGCSGHPRRSEEHTSELQSLMRNSYAVFCLKKKTKQTTITKS